jgi:hypothetical protein
MPILTTSVNGLPVAPHIVPLRTPSENVPSRQAPHAPGHHIFAINADIGVFAARRAVCRTARPSVELIASPANIRSRLRLDTDALGKSGEKPQGLVIDRAFGKSIRRSSSPTV